MANLKELETYLDTNCFLGSKPVPTLVDYKQCEAIDAASIDADKMPRLARWHAHITYLKEKYPVSDWRGDAVPAGKAPDLAAAAKKEAAMAAKKDAAPKEGKKEEKKDDKEAKEPTPEELEQLKKAKLKKVKKEGGKRGVEIEGAGDMGGLQFFCTSIDEPEGDLDLLLVSMAAMNEKSDPTEEERKGGSGHIGKMIFSAGVDQLAVVAYVPEDKQDKCDCKEWLEKVLGLYQGTVVSSAKDISTGFVKTDSNKNIFPLKIRDSMFLEANNFLRKLGLFPEDNGDSDDDPVFGDDDFPSM